MALTYGVAWTPARADLRVAIHRADARELAALAGAMHDQLSAVFARADAAAPAAEAAPPPAPAAAPAAEPRERQVPVLARRLRNGEVIAAGDIAWMAVPDDRRAQDLITDADDLIGMTPRRPLGPQQPLRPGDVQQPIVISRGETVAMLLQVGRLSVATRGRALDSGARGDVIRVLNVDSRRTVDAVVAGPGTVTVRTGASVASLN